MYTNKWLEFMLHVTIHKVSAGIKCKCQQPECKQPTNNNSDDIRIEIFMKPTDLFM